MEESHKHHALLLHYDALAEFNRQFYKNLLTTEHVKSQEIHISKLTYPDSGTDDQANIWGYVLEKDGVRYLLPSTDSEGRQIKLRDTLPIYVTLKEKVAARGDAYFHIVGYQPAKIVPQQTMCFRELVDTLNSFSSTNPTHRKLMWLVILTQYFNRAYFRICSPPSCGKDSCIDTLGNLVGGIATIENPTVAKLEERSTCLKLLAINEVVDIQKAQWEEIEQVLLAMGAFKPMVTKRSRATSSVGEVIDISDFSLALFYNDITEYTNSTKFFDFVTKGAVKDRFPPLRFYGQFTEDFNEIQKIDLSNFVARHMDDYKNILRALVYYKQSLSEHTHDYKRPSLSRYPSRWQTNLERLFLLIDVYASSQEEFNTLTQAVFDCIQDYKDMLKFPDVRSEVFEGLNPKMMFECEKEVARAPTFTKKIEVLKSYKAGKKRYGDIAIVEDFL